MVGSAECIENIESPEFCGCDPKRAEKDLDEVEAAPVFYLDECLAPVNPRGLHNAS